MRVQGALMVHAVGALGQDDRPLDRLDDVGQADLRDGPGQRIASASSALAHQKAVGGKLLHQLLGGRQWNAGVRCNIGRTQARAVLAAGGRGHHHDRIVGKMGESHLIRSFLVLFKQGGAKTQPC